MAQTWQDISENTALAAGDVVRVWVKVAGTSTYPRAVEIEGISRKLNSDSRWRVEGYSQPDAAGAMFFRLRVLASRPSLAGGFAVSGTVLASVVVGAVLGGFLAYGYMATFGAVQKRTIIIDDDGNVISDTTEGTGSSALRVAWVAVVGWLAVKLLGGKA